MNADAVKAFDSNRNLQKKTISRGSPVLEESSLKNKMDFALIGPPLVV